LIFGEPLRFTRSFYKGLEDFGDNLALIADGGTISYRELDQLINARIARWVKMGVKQGMLAALPASLSVDSIVNFLAALKASLPVFVHAPSESNESISALYDRLAINVVLGDQISTAFRSTELIDLRPDLAVLLNTSGSSGKPKLVMLSYNNLATNAAAIAQYQELESSDVAIANLPISYPFGLSIITSHFHVGASCFLTNQGVLSARFWADIREHGCTSFYGVPWTYQALRRLRFESFELPALRRLAQAGGRLEPQLVSYFAELAESKSLAFFVMYGQTEASPRISYLPPKLARANPDSVGIPIPGGCIFLRPLDEEFKAGAGSSAPGELCFKGPNVMLGYALNKADLCSTTVLDELRTGDIAEIDGNGLVRIIGRLTRFVKLKGRRIQLDAIEHEIKDSLLMSEDDFVVCVGRDDLLGVAVPMGFIKDVDSFLRTALGLHQSLFRVVGLQIVPRLASGKIDFASIMNMCSSKSTR
jgi:long-chain acyl-CoA synthetase